MQSEDKMKKIDLNRSVFDNVTEHPELADILASLGFKEIVNKAMLNSVGRIMTIPKGSAMKGIPMDIIKNALRDGGFVIAGEEEVQSEEGGTPGHSQAKPSDNRTELLKSYLKRLGEGEDLVSVRKDFVANFAEVDASEIMKAEQEIISEGTPIEEIQKLCDLHSALFHGCTSEEKKAGSIVKTLEPIHLFKDTSKDSAASLVETKGHPLYTFTKENEALERRIAEAKSCISSGGDVVGVLSGLRDVSIHYAKKGDLLYPHLKVKYDIFGPSSVMWTIDDEIRDELGALAKLSNPDEEWKMRLTAAITRMEEMIYKEANILFPVCASNFKDDEWRQIYKDSKDYADCFGVQNEIWAEGEEVREEEMKLGAEIVMPGGHMTVEQMTAMLDTIPMEITFVDADNINRYFNENEGPKVFKRPAMAIDRDVFSCHPPKIESMVRAIIDDFRSGKRDRVQIWMDKNGKTMLVTYYAVRSKKGEYLGTLELVQDMDFAKEHFLKGCNRDKGE